MLYEQKVQKTSFLLRKYIQTKYLKLPNIARSFVWNPFFYGGRTTARRRFVELDMAYRRSRNAVS